MGGHSPQPAPKSSVLTKQHPDLPKQAAALELIANDKGRIGVSPKDEIVVR